MALFALRLTVAALAWTGLVVQAAITIHARHAAGAGPLGALGVMLSSFTVLANAAGALSLSLPLLLRRSPVARLFAQPSIATGNCLCMVVVGLVYAVFLRKIWTPAGPQQVAALFLHQLSPWGYVLHWLLAVRRQSLGLRDLGGWLVFPIAYLTVSLARGMATGTCPYFFLDFTRLGFGHVLVNCTWIGAGFLAAGVALIGLDRLKPRTH